MFEDEGMPYNLPFWHLPNLAGFTKWQMNLHKNNAEFDWVSSFDINNEKYGIVFLLPFNFWDFIVV